MALDMARIGDNSGDVPLAQQISENLREKHPDVVKRSGDLAGMIDRAPTAVDNEDDANKVSEAVRQCSAFLKMAGELRVSEKEPYLEGGRAVDGFFRNLTDTVEKTKNALLRVRTDYDVAVERAARQRREEEARKAREEAERIAAEAKTRADLERVAVAESRAEEAHQATKVTAAELTRTRTDTGVTTSLRSEWDFEILEARKVPRKFCVPDPKLIKAAVKSAVTADNDCPLEVAGVRIFLKHVSQVR